MIDRTEHDEVVLAEFLLRKLFSWREIPEHGLKVKMLYHAMKEHNKPKSIWRQARKNIGLVSVSINGEQFWRLPREEK